MRTLTRILLMLCVTAVMSGCASTELRIRVDLYDEDPRVDLPMTPRKARLLIADLQTLRSEARKDVNLRIGLARDSVDVYSSVWTIVGKDDGNRANELQERLATYTCTLEENFTNYEKSIDAAVKGLRGYVVDYQRAYKGVLDANKCNQPEEKKSWLRRVFTGPARSADRGDECIQLDIRDKLLDKETRVLAVTADAIAGFRDVGSSNEPFTVDWSGLEYALNAAYFEAQINGNREHQSLLLGLGKNTAGRINSLTKSIAESGRPVPANPLRSPHAPSTLAGSSLAIANELETLRNDLPETATSRAALSGLVTGTSRFIELIDRLQDPGDPIWRVVTNQNNEQHWNEDSVESYFYAEGDAGVVIVRDDPLHYRVHSARNNPQTLIEGQLDISRSIANAALSIAGAASGLPTSSLASSDTGSKTAAGVDTESDGFALRRATAEAWERQRTIALTSLQRYLRSLSTNIDELEDNDAKGLVRQITRLKSVLKGHKPLLEIPAEE